MQTRYREATHSDSQIPESERPDILADYQKLQEYIKAFIGTDLGRTPDGVATLFGKRMGEAQLSDGQKILIQLCLAIYAQGASLDNLILFMDEPENHLHPEILLETIDRIQKVAPNAQLWIATHSVPLLSHFEPDSLWYVSAGTVKHAGRAPETVLRGLLGSDEEIGRLESFLGLPAQFATAQYALECLIAPATSDSIVDDQSKQVTNTLLDLKPRSKAYRVLDFGAGRGRMIGALFDRCGSNQTKLTDLFDYRAFDPDTKNSAACRDALVRAYGTSDERYFSTHSKLLETLDKNSVDVVVMTNVLHEIDPKDWLSVFSPNGSVASLLADDGHILIVEDQRIPKGELAHSKGFLVLDTLHLKRLFAIKETDTGFKCFDARNDGRLKAHAIPKQLLSRISSETRKEAISTLAQTAKEEIARLRSNGTDFKTGLLHGFWVQQFANAQLALEELGT